MHGWRFDGSGACVEIPYASHRSRYGIETWPVEEADGLVWTYYDPAHGAPTWRMPPVPEYGASNWTPFRDEGNRWVVRTHPQVIQENACDVHHLGQLHHFPDPQATDVRTDGPVLTSSFTHKRSYAEAGVTEHVEVETSIAIYGMGMSKQTSRATGGIESTSLCTTTPIDEHTVDLRMASAVRDLGDPAVNELVHEAVLETSRATIEEDIPVWESRDYSIAHFHDGDRSISTFQRWARQFYPAPEKEEWP
jgi:hypothetical protein